MNSTFKFFNGKPEDIDKELSELAKTNNLEVKSVDKKGTDEVVALVKITPLKQEEE